MQDAALTSLDYFGTMAADGWTLIEGARWPGGPVCPYCGTRTAATASREAGQRLTCPSCRSSFSVTVGTVMEGTRVDPRVWLLAARFLARSPEESIASFARAASINKNTASRISSLLTDDSLDKGFLLAALEVHEHKVLRSTQEDRMLKAAYKGVLDVGHESLRCFVLSDGTRVLSGRSMTTAIGMKGRAQGVGRIAAHSKLRNYFSSELVEQLENPILFSGSTSRTANPTQGYEATVLLNICESILAARDAGALQTEAEARYGKYCDALIRSFAKVGIIALVDEATGYQEVRARDELHRILESYIAKELLPWTKRFPDEFYKEIFRLKGWEYDSKSVKRPSYIGKLTNNLVYDRMPNGVLDELKNRNPTNASGNRKYRHHQLLTPEIGNPHLEKHLASTVALMRASQSWPEFERLFNRSFPKPNEGFQEEFVYGD